MAEKKILIVHPYDKTTSFLDRIKNHLQTEFEKDVHYYSVKPNEESHKQCLDRIVAHDPNGLIIFLGHGRSDKLYGSKADEYSPFTSADAVAEFPEKYYFNDNFINENNISVFKDKKIFCLACKSADKISQFAFKNGVKSFVGFGDIPTSEGEFQDKGEKVSEAIVKAIKTELNYIVKTSLAYSIKNNLSFDGLLNIFQFVTNQKITEVLVKQKQFKERYILADYLYYLKKEAQIVGDAKIKLLA